MKNKNINHEKIVWFCPECKWVGVSDSHQHHQIDSCQCGKCGIDLEYYHCRISGFPKILMVYEYNKDKWIRKNERPKKSKTRKK